MDVYYCICRGVLNPGNMRISHVMKAIPTTLDQLGQLYKQEVEPLYSQGLYDLHTFVIERPADVNFLAKIADQARPAEASHATEWRKSAYPEHKHAEVEA